MAIGGDMTKRTDPQNRALHVYCREVANALNDGGYSLNAVLEAKSIDVDCTQENIKEVIFKAIMHALYPDITSTTQLEKLHVTDVYEHMNRFLSNNFERAQHVTWPSEGEQ